VSASVAQAGRGVVLEPACAVVESLLGEEGARQVLVENPQRLLQGRYIPTTPRAPVAPPRAPSLLSRLLRRS
jgi:hypothetical protein